MNYMGKLSKVPQFSSSQIIWNRAEEEMEAEEEHSKGSPTSPTREEII